nr:class I SAM-dependent methyltransferase [Limosilactobacillus fermentum]
MSQADRETKRRLLQLGMLKVTQKDAIQATHQMTPDSIGMLMASLIERVTKIDHPYRILDPVVGTANLLTTVMNHLQSVTDQPIEGYGVDNDESMLSVAAVSTQLQDLPVQLYHQDAIRDLDVPQVDLVVADLPVGYYPLDDNTKRYRTRAKEGHSYVHHLLIEQAMNYLLPGGFGVFLVPKALFQSKETAGLVEWIQSVAYMQGLINLPEELFANPTGAKSLLLLQRQGGASHQAGKVLLGSFPSVKNRPEFIAFIREIDNWVAQYLAPAK